MAGRRHIGKFYCLWRGITRHARSRVGVLICRDSGSSSRARLVYFNPSRSAEQAPRIFRAMMGGIGTRMKPLFDKECELVGWIDPQHHIFKTDMDWVAFWAGGHAWSAESGDWLGPVRGLVCLDQAGRVVAWNPDARVAGTSRPTRPSRASRASRPSRPSRPSSPLRPSRPSTPSGGWSELSFWGWLDQ